MSNFRDLAPIPEQYPLQFHHPPPSMYPMHMHPMPLHSMHMLPPPMQPRFQPPYPASHRGIPPHNAQSCRPGGIFYNPPSDALALFSTRNRMCPSREIPVPLPPVIIRTDIAGDVSRKVKSISLQYPHVVRQFKDLLKGKEIEWKWLCDYFDPVDIWVEGHEFCFHVLDQIANGEIRRKAQAEAVERLKVETEAQARKFRAERIAEIETYAAELAEIHTKTLIDPAYINPLAEICRRDPWILDGEESEDDRKILRRALLAHRSRLMQEEKERVSKQAEIALIEEKNRKDQIRKGKPQAQHTHTHSEEYATAGQAREHAFPSESSRYVHIEHGLNLHGTHADLMGVHPHSDIVRPRSYDEFMFIGTQAAGGPVPQASGAGRRYQEPFNRTEGRPRRLSNESARIGHAKGNNRGGNYNFNRKTQRSGNATNSKGSPSKYPGPQEPVYFHNDSRPSLANLYHNSLNRVVSAPSQSTAGHHSLPQRLPDRHGAHAPAHLVWHSAATTQAPVYPPQLQPNYSSTSSQQAFYMKTDKTKLQNNARAPSWKSPSDGLSSNDHAPSASLEKTNGANSLGHVTKLDGLPHYGQGGTQTIFYNGSHVHLGPDEQRTRTVWVGGVCEEFFRSHKLKDVLSRCGPLEKIAWVPPKLSNKMLGFAFADFVHEDSVRHAITQLDGLALSSTHRLTVNVAYTEADKKVRGTSYSSQNGYVNEGSSKCAGARDCEQRPCDQCHPSLFNRPPFEYAQINGGQNKGSSSIHSLSNISPASNVEASAPQVARTEYSMVESLRSSVAEVFQKHEAINRLSQQQTPLGSIENIPIPHNVLVNPSPQRAQATRQETTTLLGNVPNEKENAPIANQQKGAQPSGPKSKNGPGRGKKNKGAKPKPSPQPTPASTPIKVHHKIGTSMPILPLQQSHATKDCEHDQDIGIELDALNHNASTSVPGESKSLENTPKQYVLGSRPEWKNKHQSKKRKIDEQSPGCSVIPPPPSRVSAATTENSSDSTDGTSMTRSGSESGLNSFATVSSRKQSVVSGSSDGSSNQKPDNDNDDGSALPSPRNLSTSSKNDKDTGEFLYLKGPTRAKPERLAQKQAKPAASSQRECNEATHSKNDGFLSIASSKSVRKADAKAKGDLRQHVDLTATPDETVNVFQRSETHRNNKLASEEPAPKTQSRVEPSTINLYNPKEWPALGSVNYPLSAIADGRRPPPINPLTVAIPLGENARKLSRSTPVVAVPRNLMSRPPPAYDNTKNRGLGSWRWPFVRSSRGL